MSDTQYDRVKKSVISGFIWQGIVKSGVQISTWASTIVVARLLHPDDYGLMAIQGVYSGLIILLVDFGVTNGLINIAIARTVTVPARADTPSTTAWYL